MKVNEIYVGSISAGDSKTFMVQKTQINGFLSFTELTAKQSKILVDVMVRGDNETIHLANRLNLSIFAELSNQIGGYSSGLNNVLVSLDNEDQVTATSGLVLDFHPLFMKFGCIDTDNSVVEIRLTNTDTEAVALGLYTALYEITPDYMIQYIKSEAKNMSYPNVEELYLIADAGIAPTADISVTLKDAEETTTAGIKGYYASTVTMTEVEVFENLKAVKIYENIDDIPDDVSVNLVGADIASVSILHVAKLRSQKRVARSTITNLARHSAKIEKIERDNPVKAKALRFAGKIIKSSSVRSVISKLRS